MKKLYSILAIAALSIFGTDAMAQSLSSTTTLWGNTITSTNTTCRTQGSAIAKAYDGSGLYILGSGAIKTENDALQFGETTITTGTDATGATSGNNSLFFVKTDLDGNFMWSIKSKEGDFTANSSYLQPTKDGGAVLFLLVRNTQKDLDRSIILVDANDKQTVIDHPLVETKNIYSGLVVKTTANGSIKWTKLITADTTPAEGKTDLTTQGIYPGGLTIADNGDIFITGRSTRDLHIDGTTIASHNENSANLSNGGNMFIIKLNPKGQYFSHIVTEGTSTKEQPLKLIQNEGKLYLLSLINPIADTEISFGGQSVIPENTNPSLSLAQLDVNLNVNYFKVYESSVSGGAVQTPFITVNGDELYITGKAKLGIDDLGISTTLARVGLILKGDANTGELTAGRFGTTNQEGYFGVIFNNDNVPYLFSHVLNGALSIEKLNATTLESEEKVALYSQSSDVQNVATNGENVYVLFTDKNAGESIDGGFSNSALAAFSTFVVAYKLPEKVTTAINDIKVNETKVNVYGGNGVAHIVAEGNSTVNIYSVNGAQVARVNTTDGDNTVALPQGIYIANGQKIIVR